MSNERLRAAIRQAGLDNEQLAEMVQVDAKTVERWVAGRVPYNRHRGRVAKALGADERDLWPDSHPAAATPSADQDLLAVYENRDAAGVPDWQVLMTDARRRIDLLDMSLLDIVSVPGVIDLLAAKAAAGCEIRILIAAPYGYWSRFESVTGEASSSDESAQETADEWAQEIQDAREYLLALLGARGIEVREYLVADPDSILRFDDQILFSPGLWITDRTQTPLLHVTRRGPEGPFDRLVEHLEAVWTRAGIPVHPGWRTTDEEDDEEDDQLDGEDAEPLLTAQERELLTTTLTRWRLDGDTIADTLADAVFAPGLTGLQSADPTIGPGVAIMVDENRDPPLARLFRIRTERNDQAFLANWAIHNTRTRVFSDPDGQEALIAYTIHVTRPLELTRTYLLLASKGRQPLAWLAEPGTNVWLIPRELAIREWAKEGAGASADLYDRMLPLGEVIEPSLAIQAALRHIRPPES